MSQPPSSVLADNKAYREPPLEADIVMKGGITSGIVYPDAVCQLARRYRFRSVGGTSAGAIAAAAAAAAEYGREKAPGPKGGFAGLHATPEELGGSDQGGETKLLSLFQADPRTMRLFEVALVFMRRGWPRGIGAALLHYQCFPLLSAALIVTTAVLVIVTSLSAWALGCAVLAGVVVALLGAGFDLSKDALAALPANHFGLCRLGPNKSDPESKPLTVWLFETLQALSGKDGGAGDGSGPPLTFANLWGLSDEEATPEPERAARANQARELERDPRQRSINLEVMTTDLTHARPLRLPIPRDEHEDRLVDGGGRLLIDLGEFSDFFPQQVIEHLRNHAPPPGDKLRPDLNRLAEGREFVHLPSAELPVVVAARMSLSFPGLISAVPLFRLRYRSEQQPVLERVLLSDGGITSNFPIHFFDGPLPRRPTFGLDLTGFAPDGGTSKVTDPDPPATKHPWEPWTEITTLRDFGTAIKDAMQNWRDNAQARLPGFRDRVEHIHMDKGEGGLNLAMDEAKIRDLAGRGSEAGLRLVDLFSGDPGQPPQQTEHWNGHRFVRYRVAMQGVERFLRDYSAAFKTKSNPATISYSVRIAEAKDKLPYPFDSEALLEFAVQTTREYRDLVSKWEREKRSLSDSNVPKPTADLRAGPRV